MGRERLFIGLFLFFLLLFLLCLYLLRPHPPHYLRENDDTEDDIGHINDFNTWRLLKGRQMNKDWTAHNALAPQVRFLHHKIFTRFPLQPAVFHEDYLTDFLGIRTKWIYDCRGTGGYLRHCASRAIPCAQHSSLMKQNEKIIKEEIKKGRKQESEVVEEKKQLEEQTNKGFKLVQEEKLYVEGDEKLFLPLYPVIDEEYFQMIDVLSSVLEAKDYYVSVELGARYGTWIGRSVAALRRLYPSLPHHAVGVEAEPATHAWMKDHFSINGFTNATFYNNFVAKHSGKTMEIAYEGIAPKATVKSIRVKDVLKKFDYIDYLDVDIQGAEEESLEDEMELLSERVKRIHIGTHNKAMHFHLRKLFLANGFEVVWDFPGQDLGDELGKCDHTDHFSVDTYHTHTIFGPIVFRDGVLSVRNTRFEAKAL